ncbi:MAG: dTDP-4-amino-4,6-dideoxygalactose transaminase [Bacteroidota bacterium]
MTYSIPFNKPHFTGKETKYIEDAVRRGKISGNGYYTKNCHQFFEERYGFKKCLLTTSCTDALEMCAILIDIQPGDEVIMPSYTFVSTANAFILRGAKVLFADSRKDFPGIDEDQIEALVTERTKAIVVVHYAGISCDMVKIMDVANRNKLYVIEDAAQGIDSYFENKPLGGIGHLGCFSFHETKNISSGEGGMLCVNDDTFLKRAEIVWEKGTNRSAFFRGEVDKYSWVDLGSSFLPSELVAAVLRAQLDKLDNIQDKRKQIFSRYAQNLKEWADKNGIALPYHPEYATKNGHMFYMVLEDLDQRTKVIENLKQNDVMAVFHYLGLHNSPYYEDKHKHGKLNQTNRYTDCLVRLPFYYDLDLKDVDMISNLIKAIEFN